MNDLVINIPESEASVIIREWEFLLGSGAEIYFQKPDGKCIKMGDAGGGDDGYCPFQHGLYDVSFYDNGVKISWSFRASETDKEKWRSKTFEYPRQ